MPPSVENEAFTNSLGSTQQRFCRVAGPGGPLVQGEPPRVSVPEHAGRDRHAAPAEGLAGRGQGVLHSLLQEAAHAHDQAVLPGRLREAARHQVEHPTARGRERRA